MALFRFLEAAGFREKGCHHIYVHGVHWSDPTKGGALSERRELPLATTAFAEEGVAAPYEIKAHSETEIFSKLIAEKCIQFANFL